MGICRYLSSTVLIGISLRSSKGFRYQVQGFRGMGIYRYWWKLRFVGIYGNLASLELVGILSFNTTNDTSGRNEMKTEVSKFLNL